MRISLSCWIVCLAATSILYIWAGADDSPWREIDQGLFLGEFKPPDKYQSGDSKITVLKIDPDFYLFRLLCASQHDSVGLTAREWCKKYNFVSAVNAGMFEKDGITNVGYMKNLDYLNNPKLKTTYNAVLAFNPADSSLPEIQIIDLKCQNLEELRQRYQTLVQNYRMIDCHRKNTWSQQNKIWSMVVMGMDTRGNILFIFTRFPFSIYDFVEILLSLPLSLERLMYLEGGPEASIYLSVKDLELEMSGSYETGFNENDDNKMAWPIPNVIGIVRKTK